MEKLDIIITKNGARGVAQKLGEIDAADFRHDGQSRASLGPTATLQLMKLFGNGYGDREFHVVFGDQMLANCLIKEQSAGCVLEFARVMPAPSA